MSDNFKNDTKNTLNKNKNTNKNKGGQHLKEPTFIMHYVTSSTIRENLSFNKKKNKNNK